MLISIFQCKIFNNMENNKDENKNKVFGSVIIIGIFIALIFFLSQNKIEEKPVNVNDNAIIRNEHILGNPNAEIIIIEYSDTECPYCKNFHLTMNNIIKENGANVAWVYKHYPITQLHQKAFRESLATECAWDQGGDEMFWKYINILFEITPSNDGLEDEELYNIAKELNLDMPSFELCLSDQKFKEKVETDMTDGEIMDVEGTPTSFILKDGKIVDIIQGAQPFNIVQEKINKLLE